jgi:hypothetical protein
MTFIRRHSTRSKTDLQDNTLNGARDLSTSELRKTVMLQLSMPGSYELPYNAMQFILNFIKPDIISSPQSEF